MGADRIMIGPLSSAGTNGYDQKAIIQDTQNNMLAVSGSSHVISVLRSAATKLTAQTAITAITTAQNLLTLALNAGVMSVTGRRLKITIWLVYSTTSTNVATLIFAVTLGSVTLCTITTAATNTAATAGLPVQIEFDLATAAVGSSGTIEAHGKVVANISASTAGACTTYLDTNTAPSSAINLVTAQTLAVTMAAGVAAIPSATVRGATIEWIS